jgi:hypothetical protein
MFVHMFPVQTPMPDIKPASFTAWLITHGESASRNVTGRGRQIRCSTADQTRQPMYVQRNLEARSCNHCCSGKAISITYCECVSVALGILHAMRMRRIAICSLPRSTIFFHIISQTARFSGKKSYWTQNSYFEFSTTFVCSISHSKKKWARYDPKMYIGLYVKYRLFLSDFNITLIFSTCFRKILIYQISRKRVQWKPSCSMRTDGHDEAISRSSQFCERA